LHKRAGLIVEHPKKFIEQHDFGIIRERRAMATRCCIPPESCFGEWRSKPERPTRTHHACAIRRRPRVGHAPLAQAEGNVGR